MTRDPLISSSPRDWANYLNLSLLPHSIEFRVQVYCGIAVARYELDPVSELGPPASLDSLRDFEYSMFIASWGVGDLPGIISHCLWHSIVTNYLIFQRASLQPISIITRSSPRVLTTLEIKNSEFLKSCPSVSIKLYLASITMYDPGWISVTPGTSAVMLYVPLPPAVTISGSSPSFLASSMLFWSLLRAEWTSFFLLSNSGMLVWRCPSYPINPRKRNPSVRESSRASEAASSPGSEPVRF